MALILISQCENNCTAETESTTLLQVYLANLEAVGSYDVIVHEKTSTDIVTNSIKQFAETHYRIVKSPDDEWVSIATIEIFSSMNKPDLKKLKLNAAAQKVAIEYFHSGVGIVHDIIRNQKTPQGVKGYMDFDRRYLPPHPELHCVPAGPLLDGVDRHTYFEKQIANLSGLRLVRTLGNELHYSQPTTDKHMYVGVWKMDKESRTPVGMTMTRNTTFSGKPTYLDKNQSQKFEHKLFNGIWLPTLKTGSGYWVEELQGKEVRTEHTFKMELQWLTVNEEVTFPDVEKIGSSYENLYNYIFAEQP